MKLDHLLPFLNPFDTVVVTGPQRSGTTIAAKIIAAELRFDFIPEEAFREDDLVAFCGILSSRKRVVIQAPALSSIAHLLKSNSVAVVFMMRDVRDIIASERRINWTRDHEEYERMKCLHLEDRRPISELKQALWKEQQAKLLGNRGLVLEYESLSGHSLWINQERRAHFHPRQTNVL